MSRELYRAQKRAGAEYRNALGHELEHVRHGIGRSADTFRVVAIPRHVEPAFSKRQQAIDAAAETHGYRSAKGMELAALHTRRAKWDVRQDALFEVWGAGARVQRFELNRDAAEARVIPGVAPPTHS